MNREQRRSLEKRMRKGGLTKTQAKQRVESSFLCESFKVGDKVRFDWEKIWRSPDFKIQKEEFREWVKNHRDEVLTVSGTRDDGHEVTFEEDENLVKFWHKAMTLIGVAKATIKLDSGEEKEVILGDVTDVNDPSIMEKVNETINNKGE